MNDADTITARRRAWLAAFHAEDIPAMSEFVTEDTCAMPPNRPRLIGLEASQAFWREGFSAAKTIMTTRDQELTIAGDLAVDRFDWDQRITLHGADQTLVDSGACVWIWRRERDDVWRISDAIWNSDLDEPGLWSGGE